MYALFPNEARTYLSKHRTSEKVDFLLEQESSGTKEEDYVDINQIRELVRVAEESGAGEIVVEEEGVRIAVRMPGTVSADAAQPPPWPPRPLPPWRPHPRPPPPPPRPTAWSALRAGMRSRRHGGHVLHVARPRRAAVCAGGG